MWDQHVWNFRRSFITRNGMLLGFGVSSPESLFQAGTFYACLCGVGGLFGNCIVDASIFGLCVNRRVLFL